MDVGGLRWNLGCPATGRPWTPNDISGRWWNLGQQLSRDRSGSRNSNSRSNKPSSLGSLGWAQLCHWHSTPRTLGIRSRNRSSRGRPSKTRRVRSLDLVLLCQQHSVSLTRIRPSRSRQSRHSKEQSRFGVLEFLAYTGHGVLHSWRRFVALLAFYRQDDQPTEAPARPATRARILETQHWARSTRRTAGAPRRVNRRV